MFDFEKLEVYKEARELNRRVFKEVVLQPNGDTYLYDEVKQAQLSVLLNISEVSTRMTRQEQKRYAIMARGSVSKVVSILQVMLDLKMISLHTYDDIYSRAERVSKMLLGMIRSMNPSS